VAEEDLLSRITGPADLHGWDSAQLERLCGEVRRRIVDTITRTGGHLAPSLGVVELTVALHAVFQSPRDKIIWDVGHQCYAHKLLTGRARAFAQIRQRGGPSGFCRRQESPHDPFGAGHASTSISSALGIATARDALARDEKVVAVIGDGGLSGGMAFEGLDNAGGCGRDFIVVLNDNNMSISPTVGALSRHLTDIITHPLFERMKKDVWALTEKMPHTATVREVARRIEGSLKTLLTPGLFFESLGFRYLGPIDGHDLRELLPVLRKVRQMRGPVLVHVLTQKGKGLADAEEDPRRYHGIAPVRSSNGKTEPPPRGVSYTRVFGQALEDLAQRRPEVMAITAAMTDGTGLADFARRFPQRFFDVGIAEAHAVTFAAGLATQGLRPVVAVYSTFLQRAFDQLVHDVALQRLPVIFALDRAGLVGEDGATHHGVFDLAYLSCIPNFVVAAPRDGAELRRLLETAANHGTGPFAIRYPRATVPDLEWAEGEARPLPVGVWEELRPGTDGAFLAVGTMVASALAAAERLAQRGLEMGVVNARFVKPLDTGALYRLATRLPLLITVEEAALAGGFGAQVAAQLAQWAVPRERPGRLVQLGLPDCFAEHATRDELLEEIGLTPAGLAEQAARQLATRRAGAPDAAVWAKEA